MLKVGSTKNYGECFTLLEIAIKDLLAVRIQLAVKKDVDVGKDLALG
jgi:hypothetical protein